MSPRCAFTEARVRGFTEDASAYCYCGNFLRDVEPAPRGSVHWGAAWYLVARRLCPTYGTGGVDACFCKRRCPSEKFLALVPPVVSLRLLAQMLRVWRERSPQDNIADLGALLSKATIQAHAKTKRDEELAQEWLRYDEAVLRVKQLMKARKA